MQAFHALLVFSTVLDGIGKQVFNLGMKPFQINRRSFLQTCATAAAAAGVPAWFMERELDAATPTPKLPGPNGRPGIGLIGCGGMGRGDAQNASRFGDVVAVCDVDDNRAKEAVAQFTKEGKVPAKYNDFRKLLENPDVHIIVQATPDHWHTLVNLAAAKAKKDVYGEKPLTLTIDEGKRLVRAVRENKIILQTGSQQRSDKKFRLACELVRNGRLGKLKQVTVFLPAGLSGGPFPTSPVPNGFDWDFYQGQTPKTDYVKERTHLTFRYWFEYSGGTMTDWGAHHNDVARWAIGEEGPLEIEGKALSQPVPGGYSAFSEYEVTYTWKRGVKHVVKTTRDDNIYGGVVNKEGQHNGIKFEGTDGWIWVNRGDFNASDDALLTTPLDTLKTRLEQSGDHMTNFFDCVHSRKEPICKVEVGHRSVSVCHLGVIALRLGQPLQWNPDKEQFSGKSASEANRFLARTMRAPYDYSFIG